MEGTFFALGGQWQTPESLSAEFTQNEYRPLEPLVLAVLFATDIMAQASPPYFAFMVEQDTFRAVETYLQFGPRYEPLQRTILD